MRFPCPCCGYYTYLMPVKKENGFICPVCFWENELHGSEEGRSDCNHGLTLAEAKENFLQFGACHPDMCQNVREPYEEEKPENQPKEGMLPEETDIKEAELWDIYDAEKKRTGRYMKRNDWCLQEGEYHLTVLGVVMRPDKHFLITKRVMTKAWAPGWWEVSGGAAMAGEESEDAVRREVLEETGLDVNGSEGGYVFTYRRENPGQGDNYFVDVYRFVLDFQEEDLKLQEEETAGYRLADKEEIAALAEQGIFLHYDSIRQVFDV